VAIPPPLLLPPLEKSKPVQFKNVNGLACDNLPPMAAYRDWIAKSTRIGGRIGLGIGAILGLAYSVALLVGPTKFHAYWHDEVHGPVSLGIFVCLVIVDIAMVMPMVGAIGAVL
jgi:hypothetical protein